MNLLAIDADTGQILVIKRMLSQKQDVVFQLNVLMQIGFELNQRREQRAIGIACFDRVHIVAREVSHLRKCHPLAVKAWSPW
jgi:hypothetical protein